MSSTQRRIIRGRKHGLCPKLGVGVTKSYDITADPTFPKAIDLGGDGTVIGWFEDEVDAWLESRPRVTGSSAAKAQTAKAREAAGRSRQRRRDTRESAEAAA